MKQNKCNDSKLVLEIILIRNQLQDKKAYYCSELKTTVATDEYFGQNRLLWF